VRNEDFALVTPVQGRAPATVSTPPTAQVIIPGWGFKSLRAHQKLLLVPNILHAAQQCASGKIAQCDRFDPKKAARVSQRTRTAFSTELRGV
jgi:hypothetical protein